MTVLKTSSNHYSWYILLTIALMLAMGTSACSSKNDDKTQKGIQGSIPETGQYAPVFSLEDFNGKKFALSAELSKNKAILLWFTNLCKGCQVKLLQMEQIKNLYEEKGIEVVAVSVLGEDRKTVREVIQEKGITFRFLFDPKGKVTELFSGTYIPGACPLKNIFLIEKNRRIAYADHYPGAEESELKNQLNKIIRGE